MYWYKRHIKDGRYSSALSRTSVQGTSMSHHSRILAYFMKQFGVYLQNAEITHASLFSRMDICHQVDLMPVPQKLTTGQAFAEQEKQTHLRTSSLTPDHSKLGLKIIFTISSISVVESFIVLLPVLPQY